MDASAARRDSLGKRALHIVAHCSALTVAKHHRPAHAAGEMRMQARQVAAATRPSRAIVFRKFATVRFVCVAVIALVCRQKGIEVGDDLGAGPLLSADDLARDASTPVDNVSLRVDACAVVQAYL